ncbi:MAG: hypothetical protein LBK74_03870 [Treponema sp.]|jgi:hypothetical protein|nr:hypothetical protein [Treponema sp.]
MDAQWTETPAWTAAYDANGGGGTMPPSTAQENKPLTLKTNAFTRTDFAGRAENRPGRLHRVCRPGGRAQVPGTF